MRMESPLNQRLRRSPPDVVYTPIDVTSKYARFYSFSVAETSDVQIDLESTDSPVVDTYMFLLSGAGTDGSVLEFDDDDGPGLNSQIVRELSAGSYTVEATTLLSGTTGNFTVTIQVTAVPPPECTVTSLGAITSTVTQTGSWSSDCMSVNRTGKYAQFYSFSVSGTTDVQIDLESTDSPAVDTYMYLISGLRSPPGRPGHPVPAAPLQVCVAFLLPGDPAPIPPARIRPSPSVPREWTQSRKRRVRRLRPPRGQNPSRSQRLKSRVAGSRYPRIAPQ